MMLRLLTGFGFPPQAVALARGVLLAAASAAIGALLVQLKALDWGQYAVLSPVVFAALRAAEGWLDAVLGKGN